jgi:hypothetical protein
MIVALHTPEYEYTREKNIPGDPLFFRNTCRKSSVNRQPAKNQSVSELSQESVNEVIHSLKFQNINKPANQISLNSEPVSQFFSIIKLITNQSITVADTLFFAFLQRAAFSFCRTLSNNA